MPNWLRSFLGSLNRTSTATGAVLVVAAALWGGYEIVDHLVESKISDEAYMSQLAKRLRPNLVFDASGSVLSDRGALELVEPPKVESIEEGDAEALRVTIRPREFLALPPVLESLDQPAVITSERGEGISWIFTIRWKLFITVRESAGQEDPARFRLEIIF
jgi:hypothetical protein